MTNYETYEQVRGRICMAVSSQRSVRGCQTGILHIDKADLSIWFYVRQKAGADVQMPFQTMPILCVTNALAGKWGVTAEDLFRDARQSMPCMLAPVIDTLTDDLRKCMEYLPEQNEEDFFSIFRRKEDLGTIYVLTNQTHILGASTIFYPGLLRRVSSILRENLIILPSSIHEVLVLPESHASAMGYEFLRGIVRDVNRDVVSPGDMLSDNIYRYECACDDIRAVETAVR